MFLCCFLLATWIVRVPDIADHFGLEVGDVGIAIFGLALGAFAGFLVAGRLLLTRESRFVALVFSLICANGLAILSFAWSATSLFFLLMIFGFGYGGLNVAMNAHAVEVDQLFERDWMNVFQGSFSIGGLIGAIYGGIIIASNVPFQLHMLLTAAIAPVAIYAIYRASLPYKQPQSEGSDPPALLAPPSRAVLGLAAIALCSSIGEGAMADWGSLYLERELGVVDPAGVLGFASFSLCMAVGRIGSSFLLGKLSPQALVRIASLVSFAGLATGLAINEPLSVIIGFGLTGLGLSVMIPRAYAAVENLPEETQTGAISSVVTLGYSGFVFGPPILGALAHLTSLRTSLFLVACCAGAIFFLAPAVSRIATK